MATDRYQSAGPQSEWQHGSDGRVLVNKPGIVDPTQMDDVELQLLLQLYEFVVREQFPNRRLAVTDLMEWHRLWLGNLYDWAGQVRNVNVGKGGLQFAAAGRIAHLLVEFERDYLARYTPCSGESDEALIEAIAVCHVEFILIHPFREGNGRLSRLLADVMAVQAGREPLDYSQWDADKARYFAAIQRGISRDYAPMRELVSAVLVARSG